MTYTDDELKEIIKKEANLELARRDFFHYCYMKDASFFKYDRDHLKLMASELQQFMEGDEDVLVMNVPPRHGKSYQLGRFVEWILGKDKGKKIMTGSYNEMLSTNFSRTVRNSIAEKKASPDITVYNDIFPNTRMKHGEKAANLWSLEGAYATYLATSPSGTATGFGASLIVVDDLIKNSYEANNATILEGHWEWFTNTLISRLEQGGKIVIVMTRWHSDDLAGKALTELPKMGFKLRHINLTARQEDGSMLCESILNSHDCDLREQALGTHIFNANYQQEPIDMVGRLYGEFKTWSELPNEISETRFYIDTADTGEDYLAGVVYAVDQQDFIYVKDFIYTQEPMEKTEPATAKKIVDHDVRTVYIESNNGGRGFSRSVEEKVEKLGYNLAAFKPFHQSQNKIARILSNATTVMDKVLMPEGWKQKHPEVEKFFTKYQSKGKNAHDDMADAITGVVEKTIKPSDEMEVGEKIHGRRSNDPYGRSRNIR